jgi:hypothetical protein
MEKQQAAIIKPGPESELGEAAELQG